MAKATDILMTDHDYLQIATLIDVSRDLECELRRAHVVSQSKIPHDVVTLDSSVRFICEDSDVESEVTIVHPDKADVSARMISVLSPLGVALIGTKIGQQAHWCGQRGKLHRIRVVSVSSQPEAAKILS